MALRFCVLGSGSSGNASYLEADGFGLLLDAGLGPRRLARGLADAGAAWEQVRAVVLTHTHGDHWRHSTFKQLLRRRIPLHCHRRHARVLSRYSGAFVDLQAAHLVHLFEVDQPLGFGPMHCLPFEVPHDDVPTCGFRFEGPADENRASWALGYASDLGSWSHAVVRQLCDVDILAVEFNHDVFLERRSGRSPILIDRVLGERGHLSNEQGAELVSEVMRLTEPGRLQHLVLLHLSRQCNDPELAHAAASAVLESEPYVIDVQVARHNAAGPLLIPGRLGGRRRRIPQAARAEVIRQPFLPGWEEELAG
jgi:phosphoribosyl 1,2-cyclic phosphodiesterase